MTMTEQMARLREAAGTRMPPEALKIAHDFTKKLVASGLAERAKGVGDRAPDFELENALGETVVSRDLRARGPLVVSFYRGNW